MISAKHPKGQGFWQIDIPDNPINPFRVIHHLPKINRHANGLETASSHWTKNTIL